MSFWRYFTIIQRLKLFERLWNQRAISNCFVWAYKILRIPIISAFAKSKLLSVSVISGMLSHSPNTWCADWRTRGLFWAFLADLVSWLMADLFEWLKTAEDYLLIRSCVFHYEVPSETGEWSGFGNHWFCQTSILLFSVFMSKQWLMVISLHTTKQSKTVCRKEFLSILLTKAEGVNF